MIQYPENVVVAMREVISAAIAVDRAAQNAMPSPPYGGSLPIPAEHLRWLKQSLRELWRANNPGVPEHEYR